MVSQVLAEVTRGTLAENFIRGSIAVVGAQGKLYAHAGEPYLYTYMRSTAKPLQASAALECGAIDALGITDDELAIMCSSHMGEDYHIELLERILAKLDCREDDLTLGAELSLWEPLRYQRLSANITPRKLYNNCSGKHCCMLAICRHMGWDIRDYHFPSHPVQKLILDTVATYTHMDKKDITIGTDGCGVPVFALPLDHMAWAYYDLTHPRELHPKRAEAAVRLVQAMTGHPHMVSGYDTFTTQVMAVTEGRILAKLGADGVYCAAIPHLDLAVALKIEDGNGNMVPPVMMSILEQLDALRIKERERLSAFAVLDNINCQKDKVGETKAVFQLEIDHLEIKQ